jgi:group I intron endonuclease
MVVIYELRCAVTGKGYIGCTKYNLAKRFREHRCLLRNNKHKEPVLQEDWFKHGESSFQMHILQTLDINVPVNVKREAEVNWMNELEKDSRLYNTNKCSFSGTANSIKLALEASRKIKRVQTPEANEKRRLAQLGIPKNHGAKISATKQAQKLMR